MHLIQFVHNLLEETDYFQTLDKDDTAMSDQVTRQLDAMTTLRALIPYGEPEGANPQKAKEQKPFNGWKFKIDFEAKTLKGKPYHSEYWFILDKEAEIVVKSYTFSFEIRSGDYYFADNVSESLDLTASEARGLLYGEQYIPEIFVLIAIGRKYYAMLFLRRL